MWRIETASQLSDDQRAPVLRLLTEAQGHDGFAPLSDQLRLDLTAGCGPGFFSATAIDAAGRVAAYAQLAKLPQSRSIEIVVAPQDRANFGSLASTLLRVMLDHVAATGGGAVHWWVFRPGHEIETIAASAGLRLGRRLLQLRRSLPLGGDQTVQTRGFRVGVDEAEWLRVNNAAFFDHPEQGGWTLDMLHQRQKEPWFDPEGFLLHERDGTLAAFCWTKVHADTTPPMGEIYVIAVDPSFHGHGLGRAMTAAGLHHLSRRGLTVAMLYVDASNTAAMALYDHLGFAVDHADHAYIAEIAEVTRRTEQTA